ncbi:anti-anti-sigma factor [Kitasatospora gansuensis]|uniref:Anti-anti-sigma factor n=1 Tax=Kitasatospora gansuensis TaxID=258050 RepID=A0A7W7WI14_9ACTN|nr:STAS domain-containing protein [Kitasatospora gansuensis]MBB4947310.1 anti-anti-sigma factor [Kitasatospora gansuensis]
MSFEAYLGFTGPTATVFLSGELTDARVPTLRTLLDQAVQRPLNRLVIRMYELASISTAGVRCLAFTQQHLPQGVDIVLDGPSEAIQRVLRASGFDQAVTVVQETLTFAGEAAA